MKCDCYHSTHDEMCSHTSPRLHQYKGPARGRSFERFPSQEGWLDVTRSSLCRAVYYKSAVLFMASGVCMYKFAETGTTRL